MMSCGKDNSAIYIPIYEKLTLTVYEASKYSGIGQNKIRELCKVKGCNFVLWNGTKLLIKRKEFDKYISNSFSM